MLGMIEVLAQQEKHQVTIDRICIFLAFIDGEYKSASVMIFRIFPFGLNSCLKVFKWVDSFIYFIDSIPA